MLFAFLLGWFAHSESQKQDLFIMHHVAKGGCIKALKIASKRCQYDERPDAEACIKATAALRECFAGRPDHFDKYFVDRIDHGLDQDTNPTPEEIEEDRRQGIFRWWAGLRRS